MKEFINETPSELLTQLMDNELDQVSEASLYDALGSSAELQAELKHHLAVREAIKMDYEAFTPPADAVKSIFMNLGYAPPPPAATHGIIRKSPLALMFFRRAAVPLLLILACGYGAYNILNSNADHTSVNLNSAIKSQPTELKTSQNGSVGNLIESDGILSANAKSFATRAKKLPVTIAYAETLPSTPVENNNNTISDFAEDESSTVFAVLTSVPAMNQSFNQINQPVSRNSNMEFILPGQFTDFNNSNTSAKFSVFVKGISNFNSELGTAFSGIDNQVSNFSLGGMTSLTNNLKFSIEIGQQSFEYMISDQNDETILVNSIQPVYWVAFGGKYELDILKSSNLYPYAQVSFGFGSRGKGMMRSSIGLEYKLLSTGLGVIAGYEGANLWYSTNNQSFSSLSQGALIGLNYGF